MKTTLILSTYNRPDALAACLDSILHQQVLPDEVIIGDDGSGSSTRKSIEQWIARFPSTVLVRHIWHEDAGFRLAMMRNKCVAAATGEYIIEIDGDILLHPRFVADHLAFARKGFYLKGGRVSLDETLTAQICAQEQSRPIHFWTRGAQKRENALHLPLLAHCMAPWYRRHRSSGLGCNMSFYRSDFVAVNGYDEKFEGWGGEDDDLTSRLQRFGVQKRSLKFAGIVYHLWHGHEHMYNLDNNRKRQQENALRNDFRCQDGVAKYL